MHVDGPKVIEEQLYFLFVLMWPIWPQFAHLRVVPVTFSVVGSGDPSSPPPPPPPPLIFCWSFFCFSRFLVRSRFFSRRSCSFRALQNCQYSSAIKRKYNKKAGSHLQDEFILLPVTGKLGVVDTADDVSKAYYLPQPFTKLTRSSPDPAVAVS